MLVTQSPPLHLTYCLNIHPGQTWGENLAAIRRHAEMYRTWAALPRGRRSPATFKESA